ncbi:hypothetical protein EIJ50_15895, partial [Xanthomonas perforans]
MRSSGAANWSRPSFAAHLQTGVGSHAQGGGGDNATAPAPPVAHDRCASAAQGLRRMQGDASFP